MARNIRDCIDEELHSTEFVRNPYALYARLREEAPVCWAGSWRCWLLTRHDDIVATLNDPSGFSSGGRLTSVFQAELPSEFLERIHPLIAHFNAGLINVDGADHSRLRRLVQQGFTPSAIVRLQEQVRLVAQRTLAAAAERPSIDFVREFAYPLPITVITGMMGIPESQCDDFKAWTGTIVRFIATPRPSRDVLIASNDALVLMRECFRELAADRQRNPRDDLIGVLVRARDAGDRLSDEEMISTLTTILIGGHETTTNLLGSSLLRLDQFPDECERLRREPALARNAVEELLRFDAPFQRNRRVAMADCQLRGQQVRRGDIVLQFLGAANRDPMANADPERLNLSRSPVKHVAFGHGAHFCLGAALARLEAQVALNELFAGPYRVEVLEKDPQWTDGVLRGLASLQARVTKREIG
jgi:cytochrome P450